MQLPARQSEQRFERKKRVASCWESMVPMMVKITQLVDVATAMERLYRPGHARPDADANNPRPMDDGWCPPAWSDWGSSPVEKRTRVKTTIYFFIEVDICREAIKLLGILANDVKVLSFFFITLIFRRLPS